MGWLIALGVITILAILPVGVSARYNIHGPLVQLIAGPVRITLFPGRPKNKRQPEKREKEQRPVQKSKPKKESKAGGSIKDFLPLVQLAFDFLGDLRRKLRVKVLELKLILAGGDPSGLAINYGRAWAALGNLMPRLEQLFVIRKRDLEVECDFTADSPVVYARLDLTITLGRLFILVVRYGIRIVREYFKIMNKRKGGANT